MEHHAGATPVTEINRPNGIGATALADLRHWNVHHAELISREIGRLGFGSLQPRTRYSGSTVHSCRAYAVAERQLPTPSRRGRMPDKGIHWLVCRNGASPYLLPRM